MSRNQDRQDVGLLMPRQEGVVLLVMLALLFVATLLGIAMVVSTTGETRMASLRSQREFSHTLAEAGASAVALKALNDLDPNQALQNQTWDCKTLGWQGGMGSTTSQTQPGGACTIALEAQGGSYSGWLKISAGTSDTMANQLRAQAAVVPLLSGIGSIIGAPGRAGFVVAAATLSPDPGAAAIPGAAWLQRNGGWYWPVASATGNQSTPQSQSEGSTTTQPFALKAIPPTPSQLPDQPWTTYNWTDYKRGLDSDVVTGLKTSAGIVDDTTKSDTVSQRYQQLKDQYQKYVEDKSKYGGLAGAAMALALVIDTMNVPIDIAQQAVSLASTAVSAMGTAASAGTLAPALAAASEALNAGGDAASNVTGALVDQMINAMHQQGKVVIDRATKVIEARNKIRSAWNETPDDFAQEEGGQQAVWQCGDDDTQRDEPDADGVLQKTQDKQFKDYTADALKNPPSDPGLTSVIEDITTLLGGIVNGDNIKKVDDEKNLLGGIADGSEQDQGQDALQNTDSSPTLTEDPIGSEIRPGWEDKIEPKFMLVQGDGGGFIQTNPMCDAKAELIIQANTGAPAPTPGNEPKVVNATIIHTGNITFKAEAPLQNSKVADILVSKGKITVASDQQDQSGQAGLVLWTDGDIAINRPVSGAAVAGGTVTVDPTDQTMLTYNPAVDPLLLGNGKFPLAGYTLGSWTSLASAP